jgi:hypothetical protein
MSYVLQEHRRWNRQVRAFPSNPHDEKQETEVYAITVWSEKRQARKKLKRQTGALSGRQWKKYLKESKRFAKAVLRDAADGTIQAIQEIPS